MLLESDTISTLAKTKKAQHFYFKLARLSFVSVFSIFPFFLLPSLVFLEKLWPVSQLPASLTISVLKVV